MDKIALHLTGQIVQSNSQEAFSLHEKSHFGEPKSEKMQYSLPEAIYLVETGKAELFKGKKKIQKKDLISLFKRIDKKLPLKYIVFKDLREKGYIIKTALKFGADFRVYDKGQKPGSAHAKWIVFVEHESSKLSWQEFSAKNRVAHSTKKNLLLAITDEEGDISYYEVSWKKP